jgi:hypothetical protein
MLVAPNGAAVVPQHRWFLMRRPHDKTRRSSDYQRSVLSNLQPNGSVPPRNKELAAGSSARNPKGKRYNEVWNGLAQPWPELAKAARRAG